MTDFVVSAWSFLIRLSTNVAVEGFIYRWRALVPLKLSMFTGKFGDEPVRRYKITDRIILHIGHRFFIVTAKKNCVVFRRKWKFWKSLTYTLGSYLINNWITCYWNCDLQKFYNSFRPNSRSTINSCYWGNCRGMITHFILPKKMLQQLQQKIFVWKDVTFWL